MSKHELAPLESLFVGGGEMGMLMRSHDWSQTPLGPVEQWPQSLRTTVSILTSTRHPMFLFWGKDLVQFYNDGYRPSLGVQKHPQALGQRGEECWAEIWHIIGPQIHYVMTQGKETWHEDQLVPFDRNGYFEEIYFTYSYSPVRDETGGVGGTLVVCTETTQQVLSNRRLQTLQALSANTAKTLSVESACQTSIQTLSINPYDIPFALLYQVEPTTRNVQLIAVTGIEMGAEASPTQIDLSQPDCWDLARAFREQQPLLLQDLAQRFKSLPGGLWETAPHAALVMPLAQPGQDPQPVGFLILGISPRREFDDAYRGFFDLVASGVTTAIANAQAYETERKRAEALAEIDRAKTAFFSNVSHEFRTPLTLMLAPIEDALADPEEPLCPVQRDRIKMVHRNGLRLLKLVNTLLDFSRIEAGRIQAIYTPCDLARFTAEIASTFRSLIERAGISFVIDCAPLLEPVYIDREMWEKIVLNLLSNAFKFTFSGVIAVRIKQVYDHVNLTIQDTGIGIADDEIPRIFERFHRIQGAQGRSFEGSGIGLSLVQELVKLHGGTIAVTSTLGQGSCFTVSLPMHAAHLPSVNPSHLQFSTAVSTPGYLQEAQRWMPDVEPTVKPWEEATEQVNAIASRIGARILVVDDNADMRSYIKRLLLPQYHVTTAEDGVAALATVDQRIPDLVLTDVMMPRLDGFGLLKALRISPQTREVPIILLSARADEETRIEGLAAGADDYLIKPFFARELLARVEANLKMAQLRHGAALREQILRIEAERAQETAEATARQLTQILESMTDAFVALDNDWRIIYLNAAGEKINGKPRAQSIGKTHWQEWPASVGTELEKQYRWAIAQQRPVHFEHHYNAPPIHDLWLEIHAYPSPDGLGIFFRDITQIKQDEAELHENQVKLQQQLAEIETIYNSAPIGLNVLDENLRFVRINQRLAEINGLPAEAHIGRTVREVVPDLADTAEQMLRRILKTGEPILNVEVCGETPAQPGVQRTWVESFLPLKEGDRIIGISTVCEEITEHKRIETERLQALDALRLAKEELEVRVSARTAELYALNAELQHSESTLRSFFNSDAMQMAIVELRESDILYLSANQETADFWGVPLESVQNRFMSDIGVSPDTIRQWMAYYHKSARLQAPIRFEYLNPIHNRWLSASICPITTAPDGFPRFSYIAKDVTERRQAEETLAYREEQLRLTFELTHIGTWDWDIKTGAVVWNDNHFRLLGLAPNSSTALYQQWLNAIHPDDVKRVETTLLEALRHRKDYETEYRVLYPDGTVHWLMGKGRGVYSDTGEPCKMLGVVIDLSDRKNTEQILELQAVITRNMAEGICLVRADNGMIVYANPKFEHMFGYDTGELAGQHVSIVNYASDASSAEAVNQAIRAAVLERGDATYEVHNVKKDGTPFWCNATASVFCHPTYGDVFVAVHQDITDRKLAQERIESSLREKEVLLKEIHHRVKNNLGIVSSLLQMQARRIQDPHATTILRDSQNRIASIALVHEKLYRSSDLANIDFTQYIRDLTIYLFDSYNISSSQITLDIHVDAVDLDIEIAIPCGLIINELVSNALKYAFPDGRSGKLEVEFKDIGSTSDNLQHSTIVLTIRDNGVGLPANFATKRAKTLGMTLVQGLVSQINGSMEMNCQQGAEFRITFIKNNL